MSATRDFSSLLSFRKKLFPVFVVIYIAIFPLTQESWVSLLPYAGAIIALFALYLTDGLRMRTILLSATTLWMIHNILLGSW